MQDYFCAIAVLKARQGKSVELRKSLLSLVPPTRDEAGCIEYILQEDVDAPGVFYMREAFKNEEAFKAHTATPHFQEFKNVCDDMLAEPIQLIKVKEVLP